ncbi:MAG: hypothetical protein PHS04_14500, partial [Tissierellia bacterium]|nr:hypothetical protein [Tissierellia bacterium]
CFIILDEIKIFFLAFHFSPYSYIAYISLCNMFNNIRANRGEKSNIPMPNPNLSKIDLHGASTGSVI